MSTVRQYYDADYKGFLGPEGPFPLLRNAQPIEPPIMWKVLDHYDSRSCCYVFYVPSQSAVESVCAAVIDNIGWVDRLRSDLKIMQGFQEELFEDLSDCVFTSRVAVYVEARLPQQVHERLYSIARAKGFSLLLRDRTYADMRDLRETPHAFVSHDSRDKDGIAKPLAISLSQNLCRVWYDEFSLNVGDSLRQQIEQGLRSCKKCIVILTPHFLENEGWARREYDSIFTRELVQRDKLILPVWSGVTRDELFRYSPVLADRVGIQWADGLEAVTRALLKALL